jgi:hypothetical protein
MPCYASNQVLLYTADCRRTVCIHCRVGFRLPALIEGRPAPCEEIFLNSAGCRSRLASGRLPSDALDWEKSPDPG